LLLKVFTLLFFQLSDLRARLEVAIERVAELGQRVAEQSNVANRCAISATAPTSPTSKTPPTSPIERSAAVCTDEVIIFCP
jgi:hypothetical protein